LGALAAMMTWVGWLTICPALGFPTLATAAMLNRVLVPREDPGSGLGWALLLIGLAGAVLLYLAAADRGRLRPSIASGLAYGAICWLLVGAVVMPLLGLAVPLPTTTTPSPPDPMHGSFMMLHLGVAAPIGALVAWLLLGAVVGATAGSRPGDPSAGRLRTLRAYVLGAAISIVAVLAIVLVVARLDVTPTGSSVTGTRTLATGPVQALPPGVAFFSIIELPQAPGATLGPHAHVPGFAYSMKGVETLAFDDGQSIRVGPGEGGFMGTQATHSHLNADDRVPAAAIAFLIVALAGVVWLIRSRPAGGGGRLLPVGLLLLIATGAIGTWNPWTNDWLFLSIRPVAARGGPMPLPTASRTYESADLGALPAGPYVETLVEITVAPGALPTDVGSAGPAVLFVLRGRVEVQPAGGSSIQIGARGATVLLPGTSVRVTNAGDGPVHLLKFAATPVPPGA
jgi:quercetin dioxygenase-like cupin family protein